MTRSAHRIRHNASASPGMLGATALARGIKGRLRTTSRITPPSALGCCLVLGMFPLESHLNPGNATSPLITSSKAKA